jgi:hypothetical protein
MHARTHAHKTYSQVSQEIDHAIASEERYSQESRKRDDLVNVIQRLRCVKLGVAFDALRAHRCEVDILAEREEEVRTSI